MFRNQYDSDVTTWSPQGRIHQVEYAMEAVKQGSAVIGLKSKEFVVLVSLKRASSELASYQKKIFKLDEHLGIAAAGLIADARVLCKHMRNECLNHRFVYDSPIQVGRLVNHIADKSQVHTQRYGRRPYGVGLLVAGYDQTGPHLYETDPAGNLFDWKAHAIGARFQSAKTYLEKKVNDFESSSLDQLILHGLYALRETVSSQAAASNTTASLGVVPETGLNTNNVTVALVGADTKFQILEGNDLTKYLSQMDGDQAGPVAAMET